MNDIVRTLGIDKILLQASDAPHVGSDDQDRKNADYFTASGALTYTNNLAEAACKHNDNNVLQILHGATSELFPVHIKG